MKQIINDCEKYMLSTENMRKIPTLNKYLSKNESKSQYKNIDNRKKNDKPENILSQQTDKLFWCFFIILNGEHEFEIDHSFKREKDIKIQTIEQLRPIKSELKAFKLRLNEIEDELLNCKKITIKSLIAFTLLHKINIIYVWNRKYFEIINDSEKKINVIINDGVNDYIFSDVTDEKINYYRNNYWLIENVDKPIKAMTGYSKEELFTIINKLEIKDITMKMTKKVMYEKILEKI